MAFHKAQSLLSGVLVKLEGTQVQMQLPLKVRASGRGSILHVQAAVMEPCSRLRAAQTQILAASNMHAEPSHLLKSVLSCVHVCSRITQVYQFTSLGKLKGA